MTRAIRGSTAVTAVIGSPIEHSRSPAMLNAAFEAAGLDFVMVALPVSPEHLGDFVRAVAGRMFVGASVTMPHKEPIAALCDELAPSARGVGVVNCLSIGLVADGPYRVIGHNTDGDGFVDSLAAAGFAANDKRALILGAGGAARAVAAALTSAGAAIEIVARRPDAVTWTRARPWTKLELARALASADLVVDCTPIALDEGTEHEHVAALPLVALRAGTLVATLVYHRRPRLLDAAAARGCETLDGRGMLVHQGARAFTLWTQQPAPLDVMSTALDAAISERPR